MPYPTPIHTQPYHVHRPASQQASWAAHRPSPTGQPQPRYLVPSPKTQKRDKAQISKLAVLLSFFVFWLVASGLFLALYLDRYLF